MDFFWILYYMFYFFKSYHVKLTPESETIMLELFFSDEMLTRFPQTAISNFFLIYCDRNKFHA